MQEASHRAGVSRLARAQSRLALGVLLLGFACLAASPASAAIVQKTSWGSMGSANGRFDHPVAIATDASGHVYVADAGNHRIEKFSSTGTFLTKWGSPRLRRRAVLLP